MAELPDMIGKYKIDSLVAKGGMGAVYKGQHPTLKRNVILKKLTIKGNSAISERFRREARILMDFNNERIVGVYDHFKEGSSQYIVLEYVDGISLDQLIRKRRWLSAPVALYVFLEASRALRYAHEKGVIHRDIKPGNILISRKGEVKLADFGIASYESEEESDLTKEGMTLGTPSYMPPEQFKNSKNVDARADIYSMGIMLYETLTGKKPFPGNFSPETIMRIQRGRYDRARKANPDVAKPADKLVARLIRPDPRRRPQNMAQVEARAAKLLAPYDQDEIREALALFVSSEKEVEEPRFRRRAGKKRMLFAAILLILALGGGGAYAYLNGLLYEWIWPSDWAKAEVVYRAAQASAGDLAGFATVRPRLADGKEGAAVPVPLILAESPGKPAEYRSPPLYLAPGAYRLKYDEGATSYFKDFILRSIAESGSSEAQRVEFAQEAAEKGPFTAYFEAYDAASGQNLSAIAGLQAKVAGEWSAVDYLAPGTLVSGKAWEFRIVAEGYAPEVFPIEVPAGRESLRFVASMAPLDGSLGIILPEAGFSIQVDGRSRASSGPSLESSPLPALKEGKNEVALHSGTHTLSVSRDGASKDIVVYVPASGKASVRVSITGGSFALALEE